MVDCEALKVFRGMLKIGLMLVAECVIVHLISKSARIFRG